MDPVVPEDPWVDPGVPADLICLLGAVAVGIITWVPEVQVLWITEVLSEAETSIEVVPGVPEVLEAEVQVVQVVLGVVIVVVTVVTTNVGGSNQDKIDLTSYFRYSIQSIEFNNYYQ